MKRAWAESAERQLQGLSEAAIEAVTYRLGDAGAPIGVVQVFIAPSWDGVDNSPYLFTEFCEIVTTAVRRHRAHADETCRASTEALLRMQRAFLHNISHELRTPLNSVAGFTELVLSRNEIGPLDREYLSEAASSAEQMLGLVNQLIEYASIQGLSAQERLVSERVVLVFLRMVNEAVELLAAKALRKGVELVAMVEPEVDALRLCGDHYRLRQCILNLADNGEGPRVCPARARPACAASGVTVFCFALGLWALDLGRAPQTHADPFPRPVFPQGSSIPPRAARLSSACAGRTACTRAAAPAAACPSPPPRATCATSSGRARPPPRGKRWRSRSRTRGSALSPARLRGCGSPLCR